MQKGKHRNKWTLGCSEPGLYKYQSCLGMFIGFAKYRFWFNKFWWDQDSALTSSQVMLMVLDHRTHVDVHESRPECCKYVIKSRDRSGRHGDLLVSCSCSLTRSVAHLIPEVCRTFSTYQAILQQKLDHVLQFYLDNVYLEIESVP